MIRALCKGIWANFADRNGSFVKNERYLRLQHLRHFSDSPAAWLLANNTIRQGSEQCIPALVQSDFRSDSGMLVRKHDKHAPTPFLSPRSPATIGTSHFKRSSWFMSRSRGRVHINVRERIKCCNGGDERPPVTRPLNSSLIIRDIIRCNWI